MRSSSLMQNDMTGGPRGDVQTWPVAYDPPVKREDRAGLVLEILEGLARLHADTDFGAGDEAHEIAVHMLNALAVGETKVGLVISDNYSCRVNDNYFCRSTPS